MLATGLGATPKIGAHLAHMALRLAGRVVLYTNGDGAVEGAMRDALEADRHFVEGRVTIDGRAIAGVRMGTTSPSSVILKFSDGTEVEQGFIVSLPESPPFFSFARSLFALPRGHY